MEIPNHRISADGGNSVDRGRYNRGDTEDVKTAVSVPDQLFQQAEEAARRLRVSRSQLYATALAEFLARRNDDAVTACLDRIYAVEPSELDPPLHRAQLKSIDRDTW